MVSRLISPFSGGISKAVPVDKPVLYTRTATALAKSPSARCFSKRALASAASDCKTSFIATTPFASRRFTAANVSLARLAAVVFADKTAWAVMASKYAPIVAISPFCNAESWLASAALNKLLAAALLAERTPKSKTRHDIHKYIAWPESEELNPDSSGYFVSLRSLLAEPFRVGR